MKPKPITWHDGIICQYEDGSIALSDDMDRIMAMARKSNRNIKVVDGQLQCHKVRYHWNNGQPQIDFGNNITASLVDIDSKKK